MPSAKHYRRERKNYISLLEVQKEAHKLAFFPMTFQAVRVMLKRGLLNLLNQSAGASLEEAVQKTGLSTYAVRLLLDVALFSGLAGQTDDKFFTTRLGRYLLEDEAIQVNMNFMHDVCYLGAFDLDKALETGRPEGLKVFGEWQTIYQGLGQLPPGVRKSWFAFDNFYSDLVFREACEIVLATGPKLIYDVGGNTAKFDIAVLQADASVKVCILDLPPQLELAARNIKEAGLHERASFHPLDVLHEDSKFPQGADAVWMSQFLDCFSPTQIVSILKRAAEAISEGGRIFILEPFTDMQNDIAALSLCNISLYFTAMANGNSKIYRQSEMEAFLQEAGLSVLQAHQNLGEFNYTLLECGKL